jgi:hypothetical protein
MSNPLTSSVQPEILQENKMTINSFLKQSYEQAKKQVEGGVSFIQDGVSFIKEEFSVFYHETGQCLNKMALPVNNFLKDLTQIETELLQEVSKESSHYLLMNGEMVPVEKVLTMPMEENH